MLVEAEAAQEVIEMIRAEPQGLVRVSCPVALLHTRVGEMLAAFLAMYPRVSLQLEASNRPVDPLAEGIDIAIRVRPPPLEDSGLVLRVLSDRGQCLATSPTLVERMGAPAAPGDLAHWPSLALSGPRAHYSWELFAADGVHLSMRHSPRYITTDMTALRRAAVAGVGVGQFPVMMVLEELESGALVRVLPQWSPRREIIHAVFPTRRGLLPSVRALIDYLAARFAALDED
jgi:DNA-binding transcriptional LysR family regulator